MAGLLKQIAKYFRALIMHYIDVISSYLPKDTIYLCIFIYLTFTGVLFFGLDMRNKIK